MATESDFETVKQNLISSASGPKVVTVAGMGSSEEHSLSEQIALAKFLSSSPATKRPGGGIRFSKASAGGAV